MRLNVFSSRALGAAAPSRARSAASDRVGYVMERLLNRQGCCRPHPVLAATWLLGYASRSFRPSSRELRRAESVQAVHGHSRPTDSSRNAAGTTRRCQLLPVSR
jgi:hypothetical protein